MLENDNRINTSMGIDRLSDNNKSNFAHSQRLASSYAFGYEHALFQQEPSMKTDQITLVGTNFLASEGWGGTV